MRFPLLSSLAFLLVFSVCSRITQAHEATKGSARLSLAIQANGEAREKFLEQFGAEGVQADALLIELWRRGELWVTKPAAGPGDVVIYNGKTGQGSAKGERLSTGEAVTFELATAAASNPDRASRKQLTKLLDVLALKAPGDRERAEAARQLGARQEEDSLKILRDLLPQQTSPAAKAGFEEGIALAKLKLTTGVPRLEAVTKLGELSSLLARDQLKAIVQAESAKPDASRDTALIKVSQDALVSIESKQAWVERGGTLFRGLSTGSVLIVAALGLAITFGLMGVINMAHGEFITIGGYTCYLTQVWFASMYGNSGDKFDHYFLYSLPLCFLSAAAVGWFVEWAIVRHLYNRPLESLLATWGLSMILQQSFRLKFGAANVQVSSPKWLAGNYEWMGISFGYNRLFVIFFALVILFGTLLMMTKTPIGMQLRAVMQNRRMAASLGIRTARMNGFTFAFGSGLAGLAGAFLSQIGNVGPSMGESYIVNSFMIVTVGGVGNIVGAAISALGIGSVDQMLQPVLGPVMGKIATLMGIIAILQWRPGGIFPSRSRSLEG
ncbi:MAG: urea transporter, permease protein UrtB [Verrucomicrobiaceae bacterium]|nr:urea transporter, permease protein UrtB [Verrucomicrobiaceae bacterium]